MASIKEIRTHIKSVEQTLKITNAMYLISSSNLRKARKQLTEVRPYFSKISSTISDILHHSADVECRFFDTRPEIPREQRKTGYIVITGDKGMAGAYNHNVLKLVEQELAGTANPVLYLVGQVGRSYFANKRYPVEESFFYSAQDPNIYKAEDIASTFVKLFRDGELDEVYLIFTEMISSFRMEPRKYQLLPLDRDKFPRAPEKDKYTRTVTYIPSPAAVLRHIVPDYVKGIIFGALVESYCSEQNARMTAMDASTKNAKEMLRGLSLTLNRARQAAITQEITEIVGGAQAGTQ